jgi:hypothetical protein
VATQGAHYNDVVFEHRSTVFEAGFRVGPLLRLFRHVTGIAASAWVTMALSCSSTHPPPPQPQKIAPEDTSADATKELPFKFHAQEGVKLCWAAGVQMVTGKPPDSGIKQCLQADAAWAAAHEVDVGCCTSTPKKTCDFTYQPSFHHFDHSFKVRGVDDAKRCHLSWSQVRGEIDAGRAFLFDYEYKSVNEAHLEAVYGYRQEEGEKTLMVMDPREGAKVVWFDSYYVAGDDFTHLRDYYEVVRTGAPAEREDVPCP